MQRRLVNTRHRPSLGDSHGGQTPNGGGPSGLGASVCVPAGCGGLGMVTGGLLGVVAASSSVLSSSGGSASCDLRERLHCDLRGSEGLLKPHRSGGCESVSHPVSSALMGTGGLQHRGACDRVVRERLSTDVPAGGQFRPSWGFGLFSACPLSLSSWVCSPRLVSFDCVVQKLRFVVYYHGQSYDGS